MLGLKLFARAAHDEEVPLSVSADDFNRRIGARARTIELAVAPRPAPVQLTPVPAADPVGDSGDAPAAPRDPAAEDAAPDEDRLRRLIDYDRQDLEDFLGQLQQVAAYRLATAHLIPPALWDGAIGIELMAGYDLSPHRPWNAVVLPADDEGVLDLGLPVVPRMLAQGADEALTADIAGLIALSRGESDADAERVEVLADSIDALRAENPDLFPADHDGIDPVAVEVRARIKGYALYRAAMIGLPLDAIRTAHQTFLPEMEALAN